MRIWKSGCIAVAALVMSSAAHAAVVVDYYLEGATTTAPDTWSATTADPNVTPALLSRGAGIAPAGLTNGFSSNNWDPDNFSLTDAAADNEYYEWGFTVDPGYVASLSTFDTNLRRSAINAPDHYALYYSVDGFATSAEAAAFQYLGRSSGSAPDTVEPFQWMTTDTGGQNAGNPISTVDLSGVSGLQNIPGGATVTFRLYAYRDPSLTGGALTNTVALGRFDGPEIGGTVALIPEPASLGLLAAGALFAVRRPRRR